MKKLTKLGIEELRGTLPVLSREEQRGYMGMYRDDCVYRCVAKILGFGSSEEAAAMFARDHLTDIFMDFCGEYWACYEAAGWYLDTHGAGMLSTGIRDYLESMGVGSGEVLIIENPASISAYPILSSNAMTHAVVVDFHDEVNKIWYITDPQKGFSYVMDQEEYDAAGCWDPFE